MLKQLKILCFFSVLTLFCLSCTKYVWEDRINCLCVFTLNLEYIPPGVDTLHLWMFGLHGDLLYRTNLGKEFFGKEHEVLIKKDLVRCLVWGNIGDSTVLDDDETLKTSLRKVDNFSCDSLYFHSNLINTVGEYACDTVRLTKEFATVDISFIGHAAPGDEIHIELCGGSSGFYVDRSFLPGRSTVFSAPFYPTPDKTHFTGRILRQSSLSELTMSIMAFRGGTSVLLEEYPLGQWLSDTGYDMGAKDLLDIKLSLDLSFNVITITTKDWEVTFPVNVEM